MHISTVDNNRLKKYETYVDMDDNYGQEVSSSLDADADMTLRKDTGAEKSYIVLSKDEQITLFIKDLFHFLNLEKWLWTWARSLSKFGDLFVEIIWSKDTELNERSNIVGVKALPARTIRLNVDDRGIVDKRFPYIQEIEGVEIAKFRPWQMIHFLLMREPTDNYGTSVLKPARIPYRQLRAMENSLVIARMKKSALRVHKIDVTGKTLDTAKEAIKHYKEQFKSFIFMNPTTGYVERHKSPVLANDDIYMGVTAEGGKFAGLDLLEGKSEIDITDILYIREKMMVALKTPKHRLNINDVGVSNKVTSVDQGLYYSASIHRVQEAIVQGLSFMVDLALEVNGIDVNNMENEYLIKLPKQRTTDELIAARVRLINSTVAKNYKELGVFTDDFIMRDIIGLEQDTINKLNKELEKQRLSQPDNPDNGNGNKDNPNDKDKNFNKTGTGSAPVRMPSKEAVDKLLKDDNIKAIIEEINELMRGKRVEAIVKDNNAKSAVEDMLKEAKSVSVNSKGVTNANSLISAGKVNMTASWSFSASDGNKILGDNNWKKYGKWFLATRAGTDSETKEHFAYPFGKNGKIYRSGVIAAKTRASQQGATNVANAADKLLKKIDKK
jgi:hypothetical protein